MNNKTRINKFIAENTVYSRRKADELIKEGKVKLNNVIVQEPGVMVSSKDKIVVENKPIIISEKKYYVFYKPAGYITSRSDDLDRKTIYHYFPEYLLDLKPVGRLDKDSTGLLIMTNDGDLIQVLTHPKIMIPKVYRVKVKGKLNNNHLETLQKGIEIEKGQTAYCDLNSIEYENNDTVLQMTLYQGYNRQIRKMMEHIGFDVIHLKRISHATISLAGLKKAEYKKISKKELDNLKNFLKNRLKQQKKNHEKSV